MRSFCNAYAADIHFSHICHLLIVKADGYTSKSDHPYMANLAKINLLLLKNKLLPLTVASLEKEVCLNFFIKEQSHYVNFFLPCENGS